VMVPGALPAIVGHAMELDAHVNLIVFNKLIEPVVPPGGPVRKVSAGQAGVPTCRCTAHGTSTRTRVGRVDQSRGAPGPVPLRNVSQALPHTVPVHRRRVPPDGGRSTGGRVLRPGGRVL
jgi:hypothetical protein